MWDGVCTAVQQMYNVRNDRTISHIYTYIYAVGDVRTLSTRRAAHIKDA